jgi:hypothetical protein
MPKHYRKQRHRGEFFNSLLGITDVENAEELVRGGPVADEAIPALIDQERS